MLAIAAGALLMIPTIAMAQLYTNPSGATATVLSTSSFSGETSGDGNGYDNSGNLIVFGGLFQDDKNSGLQVASGGTATIMGGKFASDMQGVGNAGTVTVANGDFLDNTFAGLYNTGTVVIGNGTFSGNADGFHNSGQATVLGGYFKTNTTGLYNSSGSHLTIAAGFFTGNSTGVLNFANLTISGGNFTTNSSIGLDNYGTTYITEGIFGGNSPETTFGIVNELTSSVVVMYVKSASVPFGKLPSSGATGIITVSFQTGASQTITYKNSGVFYIVPYTAYTVA